MPEIFEIHLSDGDYERRVARLAAWLLHLKRKLSDPVGTGIHDRGEAAKAFADAFPLAVEKAADFFGAIVSERYSSIGPQGDDERRALEGHFADAAGEVVAGHKDFADEALHSSEEAVP